MKNYREKELKYLLLAYLILFSILCTPLSVSISLCDVATILTSIENIALSFVLTLFTFLCDGLIDSRVKDCAITLSFPAKSGKNIFSRIKNQEVQDWRFTQDEALLRYNEIISAFPHDAQERESYENSKWYQIYLTHQKEGQVFQSQQDYLLCRDLYMLTIIFLPIYIISCFIFHEIVSFSLTFLIILLFIAIVCNLATRIKMDRFVTNVIALDIHTQSKGTKGEH